VRPGTITVDLARSVQPGVVEAINTEPAMLLATRELTRAHGLDNVWAVHDDAAAWTAGGEPNAGRYLLWCADEVGLSHSQASANVWLCITAKDHAWWGGSWAERALQSG